MYLLDANILIEASRHYYSKDLAPGFWDWLVAEQRKGTIGSVDAVRTELIPDKESHWDDLSRWAAQAPKTFWAIPQGPFQSMTLVAEWAESGDRRYTRSAVDDFLGAADYVLVAHAHATGAAVVTREMSSPKAKKRILIPDACAALDVSCAQPFEVYRKLGLRFSLSIPG